VKTLRSHLEDSYRDMGRFAIPIWYVVWLLGIELMTTSFVRA
jgi:hypothetical protein